MDRSLFEHGRLYRFFFFLQAFHGLRCTVLGCKFSEIILLAHRGRKKKIAKNEDMKKKEEEKIAKKEDMKEKKKEEGEDCNAQVAKTIATVNETSELNRSLIVAPRQFPRCIITIARSQ
jgi:hypothetical protein